MIGAYSFGRISIGGREYTSDLLLRGREVLPGWWRRQGHGCCLEDILPALELEPEIFVLGTGSSGLLRPDRELEDDLATRGIRLIARPTAEAVEEYNMLLARGGRVAAGLHLTC